MPHSPAYVMGLVLGVVLSPARASPHLCEPHERVAFNCSVGKKVLSLCAGGQLTKSSGSLQYRFGQLGRTPELVFPADPTKHGDAFEITRSHSMQSGAHFMQVAVEFKNASTHYQLNWDEAGAAGITVTSKPGKHTSLQCSAPSVVVEASELDRVVDSDL